MSFRPRAVAQSLIRLYKKAFSPALLSSCRFTPTCSDYALEAIERHGLIVGGALAAWRVARCNPFTEGGLDTVPVQLVIPSTSVVRGNPITLQTSGTDRHMPLTTKLHRHHHRIHTCQPAHKEKS